MGLTPIRTGRFVACFIAFLGMFFLLLNRVLVAVLEMAGGLVDLALARYNNFTGRFAAQNFAEDKQLLNLVHDAADLLPLAGTAASIVLVFAIIFLVIAVIGLAFPRNFVHVLVAMKCLKWADSNAVGVGTGENPGEAEARVSFTAKQKKILGIVIGAIIIVSGAIFGITFALKSAEISRVQTVVEDLNQNALKYINAQKAYFGKTKTVGNASTLKLDASWESDFFTFTVGKSSFKAVLKSEVGTCIAGSEWRVAAEVSGFFTKELKLGRYTPKTPSCAAMTPDFKKLGRKK